MLQLLSSNVIRAGFSQASPSVVPVHTHTHRNMDIKEEMLKSQQGNSEACPCSSRSRNLKGFNMAEKAADGL